MTKVMPVFSLSKKPCRGDHRSPVDFAKAKSIAVRRKYGYFPSGNPKNYVFRRAINDRPYMIPLTGSFLSEELVHEEVVFQFRLILFDAQCIKKLVRVEDGSWQFHHII